MGGATLTGAGRPSTAAPYLRERAAPRHFPPLWEPLWEPP